MCFHKGSPVSRYVSHVNVIFQSLSHKFLYRVTQNLSSFHHSSFHLVGIDCETDKLKATFS